MPGFRGFAVSFAAINAQQSCSCNGGPGRALAMIVAHRAIRVTDSATQAAAAHSSISQARDAGHSMTV